MTKRGSNRWEIQTQMLVMLYHAMASAAVDLVTAMGTAMRAPYMHHFQVVPSRLMAGSLDCVVTPVEPADRPILAEK